MVICAGGPVYIPCAWVCINMLRRVGCTLPIEVWALNGHELDPTIRRLLKPLNVRCVNAAVVQRKYPARISGGFALKPYSVLYSSFKEVLFLDADNVPVADPTPLFAAAEYKGAGAVFWPGPTSLRETNPIWQICRIPYRKEPEFETGQMLINKSTCWKALQLTMHMNEHSDFYYAILNGDKDTFHMAWHMLGRKFEMIPCGMVWMEEAWGAWQFDFRGRPLFQHRNRAKWTLRGLNPVVGGFRFENECFEYLAALRSRWNPPDDHDAHRRWVEPLEAETLQCLGLVELQRNAPKPSRGRLVRR